MTPALTVFSPAGVVTQPAVLRRAVRRLRGWGFDAALDPSALARRQRFAGDDETRLEALHRVARAAPSVAMASRGGYGLMRLLDGIDWPLVARSVAQGTRWVGYSDMTALQLGLLAHTRAETWHGPTADEFGREAHPADEGDEPVDEVTRDGFLEAMDGSLEGIGFRGPAGFDGLDVRGRLWGGNLRTLSAMLGTRHWPRVRGGILFVEEVGEHPYRVERMLLQLQQAGVLDAQRALLIGAVTGYKPSPHDRGYGLRQMLATLRARTATPILDGLPFGHVRTKVMLPVGRRVTLAVSGRDVFVAWGHG